MKRLLMGFAALSVLSAASAMAQDDNGRRDADQRKPAAAADQNRAAAADQRQRQTAATQTRRAVSADQRVRQNAATQTRRAVSADQRQRQGAATQTRRAEAMDQRQRQGAAMQTRRANVAQYRKAVVATRHFRAGAYAAPPGYAYRRWGVGQAIPAMYFAQNYWVNNWVAYGLFAPPVGYEWIRFGPDILLINVANGEVIQAQYGFFI